MFLDNDQPTNDGEDGNFSHYTEIYEGKELKKMVVGLIIGQLVSIILWILTLGFEKQIFKFVFLIFAGILSVLSFIGTVAMTVEYCAEYSSYWIINFLIVIPLDFFIFQPIIGFTYFRCVVNIQNSRRPLSINNSINLNTNLDYNPRINQA